MQFRYWRENDKQQQQRDEWLAFIYISVTLRYRSRLTYSCQNWNLTKSQFERLKCHLSFVLAPDDPKRSKVYKSE